MLDSMQDLNGKSHELSRVFAARLDGSRGFGQKDADENL
jgi:hypothetical protein